MLIDLGSIVKGPVFVFATGAVGGLFTVLIKGRVDIWTSDVKRRQDAGTHFFQQIELLAPSYYLMSNHAYLLSWRLDGYLQAKRELQMSLLDPDQSTYKLLAQFAEDTAAQALFEAGRLYRVITERFFIAGGDYVVPDQWANKALTGLHDKVMELLTFDANVLLKYISIKTERQEFLAKLKRSETDPGLSDLREQYTRYKDWVVKQDKAVKQLAVNARAYNDLFNLEMKRLYQDVWSATTDDPLQAPEVKAANGLSDTTRKLIQKAAQENDRVAKRLAVSQSADENSNQVDAFLSVGFSYYDARQFDLAAGEFEKAISKCPTSAAAHNCLANVLTIKKDKDYERATREYTRASTLAPENALFKHNHGRMQSQRGQPQYYEEAVSLLRQAIALGEAADRPDDRQQALRYNDLALALSSLARWDESIAAFGDAIVLQPLEAVFYANLAQTYESQYDDLVARTPNPPGPDQTAPNLTALVSAGAEYSMAISLSTGDDVARYERSLAAIYRKARRWQESADTYRLALSHFQCTDDQVEIHYQIGRMYEEQNSFQEAAASYATALELGGNKNSLYAIRLIQALGKTGYPISPDYAAQATKACQVAIESEPTELKHRSYLSSIYFELQDLPRFLDERDRIVRLAQGVATNKELASYYNQLGLAYRRLGISDMAFHYYAKAIELDDQTEYQKNMGLALQALGRYDEASAPLQRVKERGQGEDYDFLLSSADVLAHRSKPDVVAAIALCRTAIQQRPASAVAHALLGQLLLELGVQEQGIYKQTVQEQAVHEQAAQEQGVQEQSISHQQGSVTQGHFIEGATEYRKASEMTTNVTDRQGYLRKAVDAYGRAIETGPDGVALQYGRAQMLFRIGDLVNAVDGFNEAQQLATNLRLESIAIQDSMAELSYYQKDFQAAKTAWLKALDIAGQLTQQERTRLATAPLGPIDLGQILNNLGTVHEALQEDGAFLCYQQSALMSPENFIVHFNLARAFYQARRWDSALSHFQESLRLMPRAQSSWGTLLLVGNCYFRLQRGDVAGEKWQEIVDAGQHLPQAHYNLGVWSSLSGEEDKAAAHWETALKVSPTLLDAEYNLGVLNLKRGKKLEALAYWQRIAGQPGFESIAETIIAVEKGETPTLEIRDIRDI